MNAVMTGRQAYRLMFQQYPDVVNVGQMCEMLGGISSKTGYRLLQNSEIESFKIGRTYKIPKLNIIAYIQTEKKSNGPADNFSL